jgi:hypothetical protein
MLRLGWKCTFCLPERDRDLGVAPPLAILRQNAPHMRVPIPMKLSVHIALSSCETLAFVSVAPTGITS